MKDTTRTHLQVFDLFFFFCSLGCLVPCFLFFSISFPVFPVYRVFVLSVYCTDAPPNLPKFVLLHWFLRKVSRR